MSVARGFGLNGKSYYTNVSIPQEIYCNFIVDKANGNGLGIRSLKSNGYINNVFMGTSSSAGTNNGQTNPNPLAGYVLVTFKNNFKYYLGGFDGQINNLTSTSTTSVTGTHPYVITSLGTATLAQWQAKGFPLGFTPAVGAAFVATATGTIGGSATVGLPGIPAYLKMTAVGDAGQTINNSNIATNAGAQILLAIWAPTDASTTTLIATAPADGTVIGLSFQFDRGSVTIDGL